LAALFQVKGQEQRKGAVKASTHLWAEFSSAGVAAAVEAWLTRVHGRWVVQTTVCVLHCVLGRETIRILEK